MSAPREVEWKRATAFHEFASALGCETRDVLAAWSNDDGTFGVMFSDRPDDPDDEIMHASLARDADGIMRMTSIQLTGNTIRDFTRRLP